MRRLFWKFFLAIWLTITGAVIGAIALTTVFQTPPYLQEVNTRQRLYTLDVAERLLREGRESAAHEFVDAASSAPHAVALSIRKVAPRSVCTGESSETFRAVVVGPSCYHLLIDVPTLGLLRERWPALMPWLLAVFVSAVAGFWLAQYLIGPVAHLRQGLSALAQGRFDVRIGDKMGQRKDEVTDLAHDFDLSASRLQDLQQNQQRLFHDVSHELRSPLSRLQAALGVLRQSPAKLPSMVERMDREIERLDTLIGEILTLARLVASSDEPLDHQALDIVDLINEILADAAFEGAARGIRVEASVNGSFVTRVNGELIYRAMENVIRNAVKYTADDSVVTVDCTITEDNLRVNVIDQGPGVPERDLEIIFRPFQRGNDRSARGGYGLGLAITRHALDRHGGRVKASIAEHGGLAVLLEIPRRSKRADGLRHTGS